MGLIWARSMKPITPEPTHCSLVPLDFYFSLCLTSQSALRRARVSLSLSLLHGDGEPDGPIGEEHKGNEPPEPYREDSQVQDIPEHVLERAVFRVDGRDARGQGHGAGPCRRYVWWEPQAHPVPVLGPQDAPDPAREGYRRRVHQKRGLQVIYLL